ncbi:MAG: DNA repair protein RecO [candidate division WOR-3 bacterium]|nr:DNA repair protein RecO [candidate division WOR-3 bacterium]
MPKILRTEAISLHSIPFAESSKIVTFYTRDFGKINFLAKGARRPKSKFGGALETFTYASLIIYKPETPKLYILSDAEIIRSFHELQTPTKRYIAGSRITEFVLKAVDFEEPNARLFNLLLSALMALSDHSSIEQQTDNLVWSFLLKAVSFLGYRPELNVCVACRKKIPQTKLFFDFAHGGILCPKCKIKSSQAKSLTPRQFAYLKALLHLPLKRSLNLLALPELKDLILPYLQYHFEKLDLSTFAINREITT